ncbi:putative sulfate exporter family transporter [Candidatus Pelagibacter bacterium]|nr:putative sulfate exporter family transporter [Candidatus Pelagibacter bacterium]
MKYPNSTKIIPGVILAFIFCLFSQGINNVIGIEFFGTSKSPISTVMIAILLGIIMGNAFTPRPGMMIGLDFTQKYILKLGIIFLGIRLSFTEFVKFGTIAIPLIIVCILSALTIVKILIKKVPISSKMSYLIAIGTSVCGATAIVATAPIIDAKKSEVAYAIANITLFGVISMLIYPYFAEWYFYGEPLKAGLFLGTAIHETSQVAAAGLIYDQQFNSPETLNVATVTKLIRNTFLVIMIPLFGFLYNRGKIKGNDYSILNIFPYFVLGFIGMIVVRNVGDQFFIFDSNNYEIWKSFIFYIKILATVFLTMSMAAVGISINLSELKSMGYKPFIVGLIAALTVGIVSIVSLQTFLKIFI